jgi:(1->4)-alpha-D-glucan 1-alpha-D-glucosylmutase
VRSFVERVLGDAAVMQSVRAFVERLDPAFRTNVLAQKLLALTLPGVPDTYQGCERVDLSLVDPDNRRPVDYDVRRQRLAALDAGETPRDLDDEKLLVTSRTLRLRREHPEWFGRGAAYEPIAVADDRAVAFCRAGSVVTVALRLGLRELGASTLSLPDGTWRDEFTGRTFTGGAAGERPTPLGDLLARLPVALLVLDHSS